MCDRVGVYGKKFAPKIRKTSQNCAKNRVFLNLFKILVFNFLGFVL